MCTLSISQGVNVEILDVRQFLNVDPKELVKTIDNAPITLRFEDGEVIQTKGRKLIYSMFFWKLHKNYPNTPILSRHFVEHILKGRSLSSNTHIDLLGIIAKDVFDTYKLDKPIDKENVLALIYEITNDIHNDVSKIAEKYSSSIDILDFIEVAEYPTIKSAIENTLPTADSISNTYAVVMKAIEKDEQLKNNSLVKAVRSKMVNSNQVAQCIAVRGFLTEVDGTILPTPILSNYTRGLGSLYNLVAESRSAAKSYYFSESPLQDSEYFARRLQIFCTAVERIHYEDCGSTEYINWKVNPPTHDNNGKVIYPGDLKFMIGKHYLNEQTGLLDTITYDDPNLYNKVLKLRSVITCKHHDKHGVCEVCFGTLAKNVSRFANIGHLCCATMTQQTSQSVLSTKHLDASSVSANIVLNSVSQKYFDLNKSKNSYLLKPELAKKNVKIIINRDEAQGLTDIIAVDSVDNINPIRISSLTCIEISVETDKGIDGDLLYINQENRKAVFTIDFLKYLKNFRWSTDSKNNFMFNLSDWDFSKPIFKLPEMEYSFAAHSSQIAKIIESNMQQISDRMKPGSPVFTLQELFNLVNTKLNVNIAALEVIIYATMIHNNDNYDLARNYPSNMLGVANSIILNRSLGAAYAYEKQVETIINPKSFFKMNRPDSVFDVFIAPFQVIQAEKAKLNL